MTRAELVAEREKLLELEVRLDQRLAAVERALRIHASRPGRPRKPYTMSREDAALGARMFAQGDRSEWVIQARREHKRRQSRKYRRTRST